MKIKSKTEIKQTKDDIYPCLAISKNHEVGKIVVLFTSARVGMVVQGNEYNDIGFYSSIWGEVTNEEVWDICGMTVTLTQCS